MSNITNTDVMKGRTYMQVPTQTYYSTPETDEQITSLKARLNKSKSEVIRLAVALLYSQQEYYSKIVAVQTISDQEIAGASK